MLTMKKSFLAEAIMGLGTVRVAARTYAWLAVLWVCNLGCESKSATGSVGNDLICVCSLPQVIDRSNGQSSSQTTQESSGELSGGVSVPIQRLIRAHLEAKGTTGQAQLDVEKTYWEILGSNPAITQHANLYRGIACWKYEIICADATLSGPDKRHELLRVAEAYEARIDEILAGQHTRPPTTTTPAPTAPRPTAASASAAERPQEANSSLWFQPGLGAEVALLTTGDQLAATQAGVMQAFESQSITVSNAFFRSAFARQYQAQLRAGDLGLLVDLGVGQYVNCVCYLHQTARFQAGELQGTPIVTAIGNFDLQLFNLQAGKVTPLGLEVRGAGITEARAREDMLDKANQQIAQQLINLTACKK